MNPVRAQANISLDRAGEQERILQHHAEAAAQLGEVHLLDVHAIDADRAFLHVVEAQQQRDDRGLARAGVADDGDGFAGLDGEGDIAQNPVGLGGRASLLAWPTGDRRAALFGAAIRRRHRASR